ncbi:MAG: DUF4230 domain-containing protein [Bacteroidia bacterium]|nr:DUF4230 domain-containing protein [Bacteroidia bacterium]
MKGNVIWAILIVGLLAGIFIGKWLGRNDTSTTIVDNPTLVREISELASLEVTGSSRLTETNVTEKGFWNSMQHFFDEETLLLDIPYTAKYGCKLTASDLKISKVNKGEIKIEIEQPALLSFEMRLDKMSQFSKNGLFIFQKDDKFKAPVQKLYNETKKKLEKETEYIKQAREKVEGILTRFYAPMKIAVKFAWKK